MQRSDLENEILQALNNAIAEISGESNRETQSIVDAKGDRKNAFKDYLFSPGVFVRESSARNYWNVISDGREEVQFVSELINEHIDPSYSDIFDISDIANAQKLWELVLGDPRNSYQSQIVSAIVKHYCKFLQGYTGNYTKSYYFPQESLQQIWYGAPGTGKSHSVNKITKRAGGRTVRTTFHPDSDYSTFVGAYKPTTNGADNEGEERISYSFVAQAFLQAYVDAWKDLNQPEYLVIEEINRGNCAQIFGDLFQLLDRNKNGESEYPIRADKDIEKYLKKEFKDLNVPENVKSGRELKLPKNLYIWATMNTSDQSLFPIDSAFKRRWDWKYVPIDTKKDSWVIRVNEADYSWSSFLDAINAQIEDTTSSEDKKLGFYFCKAEDGVISAERFVNKVLFYIYNDVFKDYGLDRPFFKNENKTIFFHKLYDMEGVVDEVVVAKILDNLNVEKQDVEEEEREVEEFESSADLTENQQLQLRFWEAFNEARKQNDEYSAIYSERKAGKDNWMDLSFGTSYYHPTLKAIITKSVVKCGIWIYPGERAEAIFNAFKDKSEEIKSIIGEGIVFDQAKRAYTIDVSKSFDIKKEENWAEIHNWLMKQAVCLKEIKDKYGI